MFTSSVFVIVWAAIAFFVLRYLAKSYFHEAHRATAASAAVAITFLVTSFSHSDIGTVAEPPTASPPPAVAAAEAPAPTIRSVTASCVGASPIAPGGVGSLDVARTDQGEVHDGDSLPAASQKIILAGWAVDKSKTTVARAICMTIDGKLNANARNVYGTVRADVGAALHDTAVAPSGFASELPLMDAPHGRHTFGIVVESSDKSWSMLSHQVTLTIM